MTDNDTDDTPQWMRFECVSCGTVVEMFDQPDYCPGCGLPKHEGAGRSVAETNANITGFKRGPLRSITD